MGWTPWSPEACCLARRPALPRADRDRRSGGLQSEANTLFQPSEVELSERIKGILEAIQRHDPQRFALDPCSELRLLARTPLRYRRQILALKSHALSARRTALFLDRRAGQATRSCRRWPIAGPSGTGKSILAAQFSLAAARRGEHVAFF